MNHTNPNNPPKHTYKPRKLNWTWREEFIKHLASYGIATHKCELFVIDNRAAVDLCAKNKLSSEDAAHMLHSAAERMYGI